MIKNTIYLLIIFFCFTKGFCEPKAIIFDCDGILIEENNKFLGLQKAFEEHDIYIDEDDYRSVCGNPGKYVFEQICKRKNISAPNSILVRKQEIYEELQALGVSPIYPALQFLKELHELKEKKGIKIALASSPRRPEISENLRQLQIEDIFDIVISGKDDLNDYLDIEGTNKPKPYIYQKAAKLLGVSPKDCLVFEDSEAGVTAAHLAGCQVIAIPSTYTSNQDFKKADRVVSSFDELSLNELLQPKKLINQKVLLISTGLAGVGKTTILNALDKKIVNCCYMDKDLINSALLKNQKHLYYLDLYNSKYYNKYVKTQSYDVLLDLAIDNLKHDRLVILDGYFGDKLDNAMFDKIFLSKDFRVKIIFFQCSLETEKDRIIQRNNIRDFEKLKDLEKYHKEHFEKHLEVLNKFKHLIINTEEDIEDNIKKIISYLSS